VCRTTVNIDMRQATRITLNEISKATAPATVSSPTGGPDRAMVAGLLPTDAR
jgi:hypothetical protein